MLKNLPRFHKIKQEFKSPYIKNITTATSNAMASLELEEKITPGMRIAIPVGSRGINKILLVLRTIIKGIRSLGGTPYLVAAMGSHGGGTKDGMLKVLAQLGISPESTGVPIQSSEDLLRIGQTLAGQPIYWAREAAKADGVIVVNRIKPHTAMIGEHESGLLKMMTVGMGRAPGARAMHYFGPKEMSRHVQKAARTILDRTNILGGIGLVENAQDQTALIRGFKKHDIIAGDRELLLEARKLMPRLPVNRLDFLIVREMGKNYSGTGMDTNIIGRWCLDDLPDPPGPVIKRIGVLDLSPASQGNANGIGLADFTTVKLLQKIDFKATYLNGLTTNFLKRIMLPVILPTERELVEKGIDSLRLNKPELARIAIIDNTLHLDEMYISTPLERRIADKSDIDIIEKDIPLRFDGEGNLFL